MIDESAAYSYFLGLISGTSADGIDAALVRFEPDCSVVAAYTFPYEDDLRTNLLRVAQDPSGSISLDALGALDARIGEAFASAAKRLLDQSGIDRRQVAAIGSHGQTIRHRPVGEWPFTMQIGDPARITERTGITTVADFRRRDVAAGGQGAPLAPAFHAAVFSDPQEPRAVLNIGGISNLTRLTPGENVIGFDCGPGNALMDAWVMRHLGKPFDGEGKLAATGQVDQDLLLRLLDDPYLRQAPPKSTGREQFHLTWLDLQLNEHGRDVPIEDVQATLLEFTAASISDALDQWLPDCQRVLVCGGGWKNSALMSRLAECSFRVVESTAALGLDPDFIEAATFAWLARETLMERPGNLAGVTGAAGPRVLGAIYPK